MARGHFNCKVNLDRTESLYEVFGREPLNPTEMTKKLWEFIKANDLMIKEK